MKKIAAIILVVFFGMSLTFAHQMEGGSTQGLFGLKAEYLHVLLNPLPVYGLSMGVIVLAAGLMSRSKAARNIGLLVIVVCAASAWPVLYYGQHGYNHLYPQLDTESQQWLDVHMERAERFVYAFYLTALCGVAALLTQKKLPRTTKILARITLVVAVASLGLGAWMSRAGGEVSHSEFRNEDAPPRALSREHDMQGQSQTKMPMADTNGTPAPKSAAGQSKEKTSMPNTPEGLWQEIHRHQSALESAVHDKKLEAIHPHAVAVKELTKVLVAVVHPDHQAAVQSGADKINLAVSDLHQAAHTDDQAAAEASFKRFDEAIKQLETQMKKQ